MGNGCQAIFAQPDAPIRRLLQAACEAMGISAYCVERMQEHDVTEGLTEVRVMIRMELQMAALRVTGA